MRNFRLFLAQALAGAVLLSGVAFATNLSVRSAVEDTILAARPNGELALLTALNGAPSSPANITTATGADADSAAVTAGSCVAIQCTTDTYVLPGTSVAASGATRGILLLADAPPFQLCLKNTQTQFSTLARSSAGTCGYWLMQ